MVWGRFSCVVGVERRSLCVFQRLLMRPEPEAKAGIAAELRWMTPESRGGRVGEAA